MNESPHPYYAGLQRWIEAQDRYTVSSLATVAGLNNATIRNGLKKWHAPASDTIQKIKNVIGLNYEEVLEFRALSTPMPPGSPIRPAPARPAAPPGFSDSDVVAWTPKQDDAGAATIRGMAETLGAGTLGRDIWRVNTRAMLLAGYAEGDFILVDRKSPPAPGDVVIAQVYDWDAGSAVTVLRRYDPPVLTPASTDPADWKSIATDNVKIMGVVTAGWRTK